MKILFINALDKRYGSTYRFRRLYESLKGPHHELFYLESNSTANVPSTEVLQSDSLCGYLSASLKRMMLAFKLDYDILVTQKFIPLTVLHILAARLRGKKVVVDWDDIDTGLQKGILRKSMTWLSERFGPYLADHITTHSKAIQAMIDRIFGKKAHMVGQGVDFSIFDPAKYDSSKAKSDLGLSGSKIICHLCTLTNGGAKDIDFLFELMNRLKGQGLKFVFLVIGGGPLEKEAREMAVKAGIGDETVITGLLDQKEIPKYLSASDVSIVYMRDGEANRARVSLKVLESLAMNKLTIGHVVGETKERFGQHVLEIGEGLGEAKENILGILNGEKRTMDPRSRIESDYSWKRIGEDFRDYISNIGRY